MKSWEKFTSVSSVIVAIAAVIVAITANEIAQRSYEIAHQTNLPIISATSTLHHDETEGSWTEQLTVNNDGFPLREVGCFVNVVIKITTAEAVTYIPVHGYFGISENYTGNSKGLLISMSEKNNYSLYLSIRQDFIEEASKDGYHPPFIQHVIILSLDYKDYTQAYWRQYYSVNPTGSSEISESYARGILDSACANGNLFIESKGLGCHISTLDGAELWHWYKEEILE